MALQRGFGQIFGQHQFAARGVDELVHDVGAGGNGLAGGQRPRRGGPNHGKGVAHNFRQPESLGQRSVVLEAVGHVNRVGGFVFVFHLGLGQRRAAVQAELHGFRAAIQVASFINFAQRAHRVGFGLVVHGQIGVFPIADHAQADKVFFLTQNLLGGILAAQFAELAGRHFLAVQFFHHHFNRQAVAVPARHIGRVEAGQRFAADDDVFQDFVNGMTDVDVAVGIGRAVVQDEFGAAGRDLAQLLITFFVLPLLHPCRLALGKVAAHGEGGFVEVYGLGVVGHVSAL